MLMPGALVAVFAILAIVTSLLIREYGSAGESAIRSATNVVQLIDADVQRNAQTYDDALKGMIMAWQRPDLKSVSPELQHLMLFDRSTAAPYKSALLLLNANGDILADSSSPTPRMDNFADSAQFQQHRDNRSMALKISAPFKSPWGFKDWCISFSRRLPSRDGSFVGIARADMRLAYFDHLFESLDVGRGSTINLVTSSGILLAQQPERPDKSLIGEDFSQLPNFQRILKEVSGSFMAQSATTPGQRLYTFAMVTDLPLIVVIAQSREEVYAVWSRSALLVIIATSILCLGILWLSYLLSKQLQLRQRAEHELAELAATDGLTGLPNRRQLDSVLKQEWARAIRSGQPLSLLMIDVDHFKCFNDRHGHHFGDQALRTVALTICASIRRPGDLAARYGGEEFLVVLPGTDLQGARVIAENIRAAIQALDPVVHDADPITVSIGIASERPRATERQSGLFGVADKALYQAKRNGRNRVEFFLTADQA
jgi:diguanylate cyclase (GGDEF)-like protein